MPKYNLQKNSSGLMVTEFHPVFLFSWAAPLLLHGFSCTATIIPLEPCVLKCWDSAFRTEFQHFFILRFNKIFMTLYGYHYKRGVRGVKRGPKKGWLYGFLYYNSIINLKFQHRPKYIIFQKSSCKNKPITLNPKPKSSCKNKPKL
jgi:hypothetical protein